MFHTVMQYVIQCCKYYVKYLVNKKISQYDHPLPFIFNAGRINALGLIRSLEKGWRASQPHCEYMKDPLPAFINP